MEEATDPMYKPYLAIHKAVREKNIHVFDDLKTSKIFNICMVGVNPSFRTKGVASDLIRRWRREGKVFNVSFLYSRSSLLAGCMGFTGIMTEATGNFSQKAARSIHMLNAR